VARRVNISYQKYRLSNGLTVILHEDHSLPLVAVNLWYRVGSKDEKPGRTGFAHLFEHLMFTGSKHVPGNAIDVIMESAGGSNNADTENDRTSYYDIAPAALLEALLWIEADRLTSLDEVMTRKQLDLQRDVVRNERRQSYENRPYGRAHLVIPEEMYPKSHPYHWPVIGSHRDLEAATVADVQAFFRRYYVPSNASLVVAGDFRPARARQWIDQYFGWIPRAPEPEHGHAPPVALARPKVRTFRDRVQLPRVYYVYHSPAAYQPGDAEADLLARVIAGGKNSRLYKSLVYEQRIAQDVAAFQDSHRLGSLFYVVVTAKPGHSLARIERAIAAEIAKVRREPPKARELERVRNGIEMAFFQSLEQVEQRARTLNGYEYFYGDPGSIDRDLQRYRRARPRALQRLAREVLRPDRRLTMRFFPGKLPDPERPEPPARRAAGRAAAARAEAIDAALPPRDHPVPAHMTRQPPLPSQRDFAVPAAVTLRLGNGIPVFVVERHDRPLVSVALAVDAGAEHDQPARPGLASLTANMLDEGAGRRDALEIAAAMEQLGAELGTVADRDAGYVLLDVLRKNLDPALAVMADVALRPHLSAAEFQRVQGDRVTLLVERRDDPGYVARVVYDRVLYGEEHPYGRRVLGTEAAVKGITVGDLRRFYEQRYTPHHAAFVVVGDVRPREIRDRLEHLFGSWTAATPAGSRPRVELEAPRRGWPRVTLVDRPGAEQSEIVAGRPGAARKTPDHAAMLVMNTILGGSFTSRLNTNLREEHGYTYGAHSRFEFRRGPGPFWAGAAVKTDTTEDAVRQILREFERLGRSAPPPDEVAKARTVVVRSLPEFFQRNASIARLLTDLWVHDLPIQYYERFARAVGAVTGAQVRRQAQRYASPRDAAIVIVGDRKAVMPGLRQLGFKQIELRDPDGCLLG
jgi:zinc protease